MSILLTNSHLVRLIALFIPERFILRFYFSPSLFRFFAILPANLILNIVSSYGKNLKMALRIGNKISPNETSYWLGCHELDIQHIFAKVIKNGFIVYDIGAHLGFFSLLAGRLSGSSGKVYAFEPCLKNLKRLESHILLNKMQDRIFSVPKVVMDKSGKALYSNKLDRDDMGRFVDLESCNNNPLTNAGLIYEATSLDDFVFKAGYPSPDLIKIDVEGLEAKVLEGAQRLLKEFKPVIICELHSSDLTIRVYKGLEDLGYRVEDTKSKDMPRIIAWPNERKMKILYPIINGEVTGGNIMCLKIIEESIRRGYRVVVNSPTEGKFTSLLRERGVRVYNIDTRRTFRLDSAIRLACVIKKEGINLIDSHAPLGGTILSCLAGWISRVPVINHVHIPYYMNRIPAVRICQFLANWITSRLFCAKIIAVSESVKKDIIIQGSAADKTSVVYNGIDLEDIRCEKIPIKIQEEFGLRPNQRIIGQVGRLGLDKGQHILIKAASRVIKDFPDTIFMIVGEDLTKERDYKERLERLADDSGLRKQIIFTGYRWDIMDLMHAFDIFVLPSTFKEGLAIVILEAMAAKKPVITTMVGGNSEIVIDRETGTLVPPEDPDKLAEAIVYHLNHPETAKKMGEKGYARVKQYFSLTQMLDKVMDIYKEVSRKR